MTIGLRNTEYTPELKDVVLEDKGNQIKQYYSDGTTTKLTYLVYGSFDSMDDEKAMANMSLEEIFKTYNFKRGTNPSSISGSSAIWACLAVNDFRQNEKKNTDDSVSLFIEVDFENSRSGGRELAFSDFQKSEIIRRLLEDIYSECGLRS